MSKLKALYKKIKKKNEEEKPETETKKMPVKSKVPQRRRDSYIDPLEYFQKEHLIVKPENMDEYRIKEEDEEGEEEKKDAGAAKPKPVGGMMMMGMGMMGMMGMGGPPHGMGGFKLNFEEMLKARQKVKKDATPVETPAAAAAPEKRKKSTSLKKTKTKKEYDEMEDNDAEYVKDYTQNEEQSLYIKLTMARNKYNESNTLKTDIHHKIQEQIKKLRARNDLPADTLKEIDQLENNLVLPDRLILDVDTQQIKADGSFEKVVKNPVSLDDVFKSKKLG